MKIKLPLTLLVIFLLCTNIETNVFAKEETVTITEEKMNARSGPGTNYDIIQSVKQGDTFSVIKHQDDWVQIELSNGEKAWLAEWLVSIETENSLGKPYVTITATSLTVRSEPSYSGKKITTVQKTESYSLLQEKNSWYKIQLEEQTGWIPKWYATAELKQGTTITKDSKVTVLYDNVPIRESASHQSEVVKNADSEKEYTVVGIKNNMYQVKYNLFKKGFIDGSLVTPSADTPTLIKQQKAASLIGKIIVLDPGHGGNDSGATGTSGTLEKNLSLYTAQLLKVQLENAGATVILTRETDSYLSLSNRVKVAHLYKADAFISIHYDSAAQSDVAGITHYYYHSNQKALATAINDSMQQQNQLKNRGVYFGNYQVLRHNSQPSVLLELGYLSNPAEEGTLTSNDYQQSVIMAVYTGLTNYFSN
ncbi:MAG: N-acetylmuramoyl-L-alanine amidase [Bacillus sp. (in: firmicutes)]